MISMKKHIPNFITSLNLASGFIAIILAFKGDLSNASWFIMAAMVFDFFDGFSARLLKAYSDIGKELDSLADVVSFGVAPAVIIYQLLAAASGAAEQAFPEASGSFSSIILWLPVIMPVCAALRLAKFNIDSTQATSFKGLPTPANALAVVSVVLADYYGNSNLISSFTGSQVSIILFTIIISLLMVTRLPLLSLKMSHLRLDGNEGRYILAGLIILAVILFGVPGTTLIIPLYIIVSLASGLFFKKINPDQHS